MKVIVQYRLRPETDVQEYLRWSIERDHAAVRATPGVRSFDVCCVEVAGGESRVTVVELIDVESWEAWEAATRTEPIKALAPDFDRLVDVDSVVILRGEPVAPA